MENLTVYTLCVKFVFNDDTVRVYNYELNNINSGSDIRDFINYIAGAFIPDKVKFIKNNELTKVDYFKDIKIWVVKNKAAGFLLLLQVSHFPYFSS